MSEKGHRPIMVKEIELYNVEVAVVEKVRYTITQRLSSDIEINLKGAAFLSKTTIMCSYVMG